MSPEAGVQYSGNTAAYLCLCRYHRASSRVPFLEYGSNSGCAEVSAAQPPMHWHDPRLHAGRALGHS